MLSNPRLRHSALYRARDFASEVLAHALRRLRGPLRLPLPRRHLRPLVLRLVHVAEPRNRLLYSDHALRSAVGGVCTLRVSCHGCVSISVSCVSFSTSNSVPLMSLHIVMHEVSIEAIAPGLTLHPSTDFVHITLLKEIVRHILKRFFDVILFLF